MEAVQDMVDGQQGTGEDDARAGKTHDLLNALAIAGRVAMDRTEGAGWFVLSPGAIAQPIAAVLAEVTAFRADILRNRVVFTAI